jgi:hypothetical protein
MTEKVNLDATDLYKLGFWLGRLETSLLPSYPWSMTQVCLDSLSNYKSKEGLQLIGHGASFYYREFDKDYKNIEENITKKHCFILRPVVGKWRGHIEMVLKDWILCQPQAHIDIGKLIKGARSFLADEEWNMLIPLEQEGLNEATQCLLFNNFTAAEFMALRTVESLLRRWYEKHTNKSIHDATFGKVLNRLDKEFPEQTRPREISPLYNLKERRNAIAHPEVISNEEEATMTFLLVIHQCKLLKNKLVP